MPRLRPHILETPHSGIRRMLEFARAVPEPLMLVSGDPNFSTPAHIVDAAAQAAHGGATGYAPGEGIADLRRAITEKLRERNGMESSPDEVCVTTGACGGLFTSLMLLADPGDEILIPDPGWSNYAAMVHVLGARAVGYPLTAAAGWSLDPVGLEAAITKRTKAIILNSPGNPTGTIETAEHLAAVLEVARRHDLWVISDEAYDELVFEGTHTSTAALGGSESVLSIFSFSKSYAMTGWRVGYVVGSREFIQQLSLHQEPVVSCASTISQHAALAALRGPQDCVGEMVRAYKARRDAAVVQLDALNCDYVLPHGSFFLMVDIRPSGLDSWTFSRRLLEQEHVAVVPGAAFGPGGEGFVRISLAAADEVLDEGIARFGAMMQQLAPASSSRS
jgi:aspartate aminotransferase